jgi:hypothetical protein
MTGLSNSGAPPSPKAHLAAILESDLAELTSFVAIQSGKERASVEAHLRWFLLENPARVPEAHLGQGLRTPEGELVGCILCVPQDFRFQERSFVLMGSSCFYVDERFRGSGGLIFLKYSELGRKWALFGNSANAESARLWKARGGIPIPHSDHELFGVLRWNVAIEEIVFRRTRQRGLSRLAGKSVSKLVGLITRLENNCDGSEKLTLLTSAEDSIALPIHQPTAELTAARDLPYLRWRYFLGRDATAAVFAFRSKKVESDVLVAVNQRLRGYRQQIKTLNVLDIYPSVKPEACASIVGALLERYRGTVDAVVLRGQDSERQQLFQRLGFKRRQFDAPTGWLLDRFGHLPTRNWYFVPADGDALI